MVVFVDSRKDFGALPKGAKEVRGQAGNTLPMAFVTTADGSKGLKGITYEAMKKDMRGVVRDLRKELDGKDVLGGGSVAAGEPAEEATSSLPEPTTETTRKEGVVAESQRWTNSEGRVITAAVQKVEEGKVHFVMSNGSVVPYPLDKLSIDSRLKIEALR